MSNMDDMITLGEGKIPVQSEGGFTQIVMGSRRVSHAPRGSSRDAAQGSYRREIMIRPAPELQKWCSGVFGQECGWRHKDMFADDPGRGDGKDVLCKMCRNELARRRYFASRDGNVRPYRRRA